MRKLIYTFGVLAAMAYAAAIPASAQKQTLEEATDSLKTVLADAKKGDAEAQNTVGGWYYRGRHVKQDYKEALQWWSKSAKQGNAKAIGNMGLCYKKGHGIAADSIKAVRLMQRSIKEGNKALLVQNVELAKKGDLFADMLVASCYREGIGVNKDLNKAIPYLSAAAKNNSVIAQRDLGLILYNAKKYDDAATWFKKGSDAGNNTCTFYYGLMLFEGQGVAKNEKDGANYMLKGAEAGFPMAMYYVGDCYMNGRGLMKNEEQALKWYKLAAGAGQKKAMWELAQCYCKGVGTPVNYDQALYWYSAAVAKGYGNAFKKLIADSISGTPFMAYMHGMKDYMNKDYARALKEFKTVEKAKVADGKIMTAAILANADYEKQNVKKGVKLLKDAAKTSAQAKYFLAGLYEVGKGVGKDMATAVDYMTQAAEAGYGPAECGLADMYFEGRGVEQSYEKAIEWYAKAMAQGQLTENAAKRYASCYENGWGGVEEDKEKAEEILKDTDKNLMSGLLKLI